MVIASFGFGYIVWLIDEFACRYLTSARHTVGLPFAFLLELHGWYVKWPVYFWDTNRYQVARPHRYRRVYCRCSHRYGYHRRSDGGSYGHLCLASSSCVEAHVWTT
jgi:hypothetical protein